MESRNYQILSTLATGGTAVLYKAVQKSLDRQVVIKRLHSHLTSDANFTRRFEVEAKAAASLDHENIVRIIDSGVSQGNYFIVMEYIDGYSLSEIMEKKGRIDDEMALLIAREICIGLDHAHQHGIIHRDIKPANIMITATGQVKITDFGLAKLTGSQLNQTVADTLLGTPLYMSPEQAIGDSLDGRSDIFSLGTICYEMVTGRQPFSGSTYAAVIQKIIDGHIPDPCRVDDTISTEAGRLIMKALSREPSKRFSTALDMAREIEAVVGQEKVWSLRNRLRRLAGGADPTVSAPAARPGRRRRRRKGRWIAGMAAAAVIAASGYAYFEKPEMIVALRAKAESVISRLGRGGDGNLGASPSPAGSMEELFTSLADTSSFEADSTAADTFHAGPVTPAGPPEGIAPEPDTLAAAGPVEPEPEPDPEPVMGIIDIHVVPEADIYIDGRWIAASDRFGPREISAGAHSIRLSQTGYNDYRERLVIRRGEMSRRRIELERKTGKLFFDTIAGASIFVGGGYQGTTPLQVPLPLPAGKHLVELRKHGYHTWSGEVDIPASETLTLKIDLVPRQ